MSFKTRWAVMSCTLFCFTLVCFSADASTSTFAQGRIATNEMSQAGYRAAAIVERAVRALGGAERFDTLRSVSLDFDGQVAATYQGLNPETPHRMLARSGDLIFDIKGGRLLTSSETRWPNFSTKTKLFYRDRQTFTLDDDAKTYRAAQDTEIFDAWALRLMPWVLHWLRNNPTGAIDGGVRKINGKQYDTVFSTLGTSRIYQLYFLQASGLPEIIEHLDYSSDFGDMIVRRVFEDETSVGGILIPTTVKTYNNEHEVVSYRLKNIVIDASPDVARLELPTDYSEARNAGGSAAMRTRELADGVHLIENVAGRDYNVMFADLGDSLIIFEAPIDLWASKIVLNEVRKIYPSKPIKYVMVTHFHDDHAAGIRTYMAEGVTVITTPGNQKYFQHVAKIRHDYDKENRLLRSAVPSFELVRNGSHEIRGSKFSIRFLDLGPTPHVDENLVAYIPEAGILFQGDYFRPPANRDRPEPIREEGRLFLKRLKERGLGVKHLVGVHGPIATMNDLERAAAATQSDR